MAKNIESLIDHARKELCKLTGLEASSTVGATKDGKGWHVLVEMVEKKSIPDLMDILAVYEVLIDENGKLLSFERKGMRKRMETEARA